MDQIQQSLLESLRSGQWSRYEGDATARLGQSLSQLSGASDVCLVASGTMAMELALRGCRVGPEDEVVVAAYDYPGNFLAIEALGATPVVVDVAPDRWTIDTEAVQQALGDRTRAIIASHLYQMHFDAPALRALADQHGICLVEDACQAPGAWIDGRRSGTWGHVAAYSFGGSKILTCGNGGAVLTSDPRIAHRVRVASERPSRTVGLSQLQAAAVIPQLEHLDHWQTRRQAAAERLSRAIRQNPRLCIPPAEPRDAGAALYKLGFLAREPAARPALLARAAEMGLPCGAGFSSFARRAARRGRVEQVPQRAHALADRTVVLDHRALASDPESLEQIAERLLQL